MVGEEIKKFWRITLFINSAYAENIRIIGEKKFLRVYISPINFTSQVSTLITSDETCL